MLQVQKVCPRFISEAPIQYEVGNKKSFLQSSKSHTSSHPLLFHSIVATRNFRSQRPRFANWATSSGLLQILRAANGEQSSMCFHFGSSTKKQTGEPQCRTASSSLRCSHISACWVFLAPR